MDSMNITDEGIAVIGLSGIVFKITKDYRKNYRKPRLHSTK